MNASELQIVIEVDTSAFEAAMNVIADMLNQALVAIQNLGEGFLEESQKMAQSGSSLVGNVGQVGTAFLATVGSISILSSSFKAIQEVVGNFGDALEANPIGLVITLVAALVAVIATCYEKFDTFRAVVNVTWTVIKDFVTIIADGVIAEFKILLDLLEWTGKLYMDLGNIISVFVVAPFKLLIDAIEAFYYATVGHDWSKAKEAFKQFGADGLDAAKKLKDSAVDIKQDTKDMAQRVSKDFTDGVKGISKVLEGLPTDVNKAYADAFKKSKNIPESKVDVNKLTITPKKIVLDTKGAEVDNQPLTIPAMMQSPEMPKVDAQDDSQLKDIPALDAALQQETLGHQKAADAAKKHQEAMQELASVGSNAIGGMVTAMADSFAEGKNPLGGMMKALGSSLKQYATHLIEMGAAMLVGMDPMGGLKLAEGAALEIVATKLMATKMAAGGLVSGSSIVNVGEYTGASHNPEVIAPLDKLHSMLGGQTQNHTFEIQGDKLVSILQRVNNNSSFALGGA